MHGGIQRISLRGSMLMPPQSNWQDNRFSSVAAQVDVPRAHIRGHARFSI
ncbi:hypothetical 5.5 kDa protein (plasmid) [Sinorhizobium fredii NGR234]|uniref:Uncharacterized protein y4zD n=1 Tax=Sinorhizobium fredii (strain NBRC 101917 / NGR234) TaxID=394 RepID=Y4ZD_SINFN|nr:RecName: Full=Uncharacterized protein y4zD [Sinorhizobium fredii NGR234]AAB91962.1 hypothetical 5.5 kDa protein [Sinorhizobium fredii NGR234]